MKNVQNKQWMYQFLKVIFKEKSLTIFGMKYEDVYCMNAGFNLWTE